MTKTSVKPLVYKPEDTMILMSVGRCKIYELIRSGELKTVRVGKKVPGPHEIHRGIPGGTYDALSRFEWKKSA